MRIEVYKLQPFQNPKLLQKYAVIFPYPIAGIEGSAEHTPRNLLSVVVQRDLCNQQGWMVADYTPPKSSFQQKGELAARAVLNRDLLSSAPASYPDREKGHCPVYAHYQLIEICILTSIHGQ